MFISNVEHTELSVDFQYNADMKFFELDFFSTILTVYDFDFYCYYFSFSQYWRRF